ncbi:MAG: hypothetical protein ACK5YI_21160, partial [Rhodospirillales bacterium]
VTDRLTLWENRILLRQYADGGNMTVGGGATYLTAARLDALASNLAVGTSVQIGQAAALLTGTLTVGTIALPNRRFIFGANDVIVTGAVSSPNAIEMSGYGVTLEAGASVVSGHSGDRTDPAIWISAQGVDLKQSSDPSATALEASSGWIRLRTSNLGESGSGSGRTVTISAQGIEVLPESDGGKNLYFGSGDPNLGIVLTTDRVAWFDAPKLVFGYGDPVTPANDLRFASIAVSEAFNGATPVGGMGVERIAMYSHGGISVEGTVRAGVTGGAVLLDAGGQITGSGSIQATILALRAGDLIGLDGSNDIDELIAASQSSIHFHSTSPLTVYAVGGQIAGNYERIHIDAPDITIVRATTTATDGIYLFDATGSVTVAPSGTSALFDGWGAALGIGSHKSGIEAPISGFVTTQTMNVGGPVSVSALNVDASGMITVSGALSGNNVFLNAGTGIHVAPGGTVETIGGGAAVRLYAPWVMIDGGLMGGDLIAFKTNSLAIGPGGTVEAGSGGIQFYAPSHLASLRLGTGTGDVTIDADSLGRINTTGLVRFSPYDDCECAQYFGDVTIAGSVSMNIGTGIEIEAMGNLAQAGTLVAHRLIAYTDQSGSVAINGTVTLANDLSVATGHLHFGSNARVTVVDQVSINANKVTADSVHLSETNGAMLFGGGTSMIVLRPFYGQDPLCLGCADELEMPTVQQSFFDAIRTGFHWVWADTAPTPLKVAGTIYVPTNLLVDASALDLATHDGSLVVGTPTETRNFSATINGAVEFSAVELGETLYVFGTASLMTNGTGGISGKVNARDGFSLTMTGGPPTVDLTVTGGSITYAGISGVLNINGTSVATTNGALPVSLPAFSAPTMRASPPPPPSCRAPRPRRRPWSRPCTPPGPGSRPRS